MTQEQQPHKKRKATYLRRKEESNELQNQAANLQQQLKYLQANANGDEFWRKMLYEVVGHNVAMQNAMKEQQLGVAMTQSMICEWRQNQSSRPMSTSIHLGRDWAERRETLLQMKDQRLTQALHYVTTRCQHLEPLKYHLSEERFEDDSGDFCCLRSEVIPFSGVQSLKDVFEAAKFTMDTLEISISEQLGHLTIRDDYDSMDSTSFISNYRLLSTINSGVTTELYGMFMFVVWTSIGKRLYKYVGIAKVKETVLNTESNLFRLGIWSSRKWRLDQCCTQDIRHNVITYRLA